MESKLAENAYECLDTYFFELCYDSSMGYAVSLHQEPDFIATTRVLEDLLVEYVGNFTTRI